MALAPSINRSVRLFLELKASDLNFLIFEIDGMLKWTCIT